MITALRSANAGSRLTGTARMTPSPEREGQKDKQEGEQDVVQVRDENREADQPEHPGKQRGETTDRGDDRTPHSRLEYFPVCHSMSLLDLFQGVGPVRVGNALLHAVALDDVTRPYIVGQDQQLLANGTTRLLHLRHGPDAVFLARPERQAGAVRAMAFEDVAAFDPVRDRDLLPSPVARCCWQCSPPLYLAEPKEALDLAPVKADDHLAIDDRDRSRPQPELQQLLERLRIVPDVLRNELHALLRKKLFLLVTGASPGLGIDDHLLRHDLLLGSSCIGPGWPRSEPKITRPASKASDNESRMPEGCPFTRRQASR